MATLIPPATPAIGSGNSDELLGALDAGDGVLSVAVATHLGGEFLIQRGGAVDVSVCDRDSGEEVSRGEPYLHMGVATPMDSPFVSGEARANRQNITAMMERHGFMHYHGEFWHYNQGDVLYEMVVESGRPARFGPVHWSLEDQTVRPYEDMHAPLVSLDHFEQAIARVTRDAGGGR